jgi:hypothetical protein
VGDNFADWVRASHQKKGFWLSSACPAKADVEYCPTSTKSQACPSVRHPNGKCQRHDWAESTIPSAGEAPAEKTSTAWKKQENIVAGHCHRSLDSHYPRCNQLQTITAFVVIVLQKREQPAILPPKPTVEI